MVRCLSALRVLTINKKIVTDETMQPVAVQIDYADWLEIEWQLRLVSLGDKQARIARMQARVRRYISPECRLSDELIAERREEAKYA